MAGSAIRRMVIVGGGTAGWMTAAALAAAVGRRVGLDQETVTGAADQLWSFYN